MEQSADVLYALSPDTAERVSPMLRSVIENPSGAFQRWKRGEITYLHMCGEVTKELTLARMEQPAVEPESGPKSGVELL